MTEEFLTKKSARFLIKNNNHSPEDSGIRGFLNIINERIKMLIVIFIMGSILTILVSNFLQTTWTAHTNILIENNDNDSPSTNPNSLSKKLPYEINYILTEIEVIKSQTMAVKVIERLNLVNDPEFNTNLKLNADILDAQSMGLDNKNQISPLNNSKAVNNYLKNLNVTSIPGSISVKISFTSTNPEKAALIANTIADEYIKERINQKNEAQNKIAFWLNKRAESLKQNALQAEIKIQEYHSVNNKNSSSKNQLSALKSERLKAQTHYQNIKKHIDELSNDNKNIDKIALEKNIAELSKRYGPKHPTMIKKKEELALINKQINQQGFKTKAALNNELEVVKNKLNTIDASINSISDQDNNDSDKGISLQNLEQEATKSRNTLNNFFESYNYSLDRNLVQDSGVRIISFANIPVAQSSTNKNLIILWGTILSFILGLIIIFLNEKIYNKFRTSEELENILNIPCLANIPYVRTGWNKNLIQQVLSNPSSPLIEEMRNLRISLKNFKSQNNETPKVIALLSSIKDEGKTTIAVLMSALAAKAGERVILIDANLRNPDVHNGFDATNQSNLVDYLTDQTGLKDVIYKDPNSGLDIIFGNAVPNNAFNLLSLNKLDILIAALRQNYDLIVIDTPSCLEASDARLVEQLSDLCLYNVKFNSTKDTVVKKAIRPLLNIGNNAIATILTFVK